VLSRSSPPGGPGVLAEIRPFHPHTAHLPCAPAFTLDQVASSGTEAARAVVRSCHHPALVGRLGFGLSRVWGVAARHRESRSRSADQRRGVGHDRTKRAAGFSPDCNLASVTPAAMEMSRCAGVKWDGFPPTPRHLVGLDREHQHLADWTTSRLLAVTRARGLAKAVRAPSAHHWQSRLRRRLFAPGQNPWQRGGHFCPPRNRS